MINCRVWLMVVAADPVLRAHLAIVITDHDYTDCADSETERGQDTPLLPLDQKRFRLLDGGGRILGEAALSHRQQDVHIDVEAVFSDPSTAPPPTPVCRWWFVDRYVEVADIYRVIDTQSGQEWVESWIEVVGAWMKDESRYKHELDFAAGEPRTWVLKDLIFRRQ